MDPGTRFRVNAPQVVHQTIDGEVVLIQLGSGVYYSLRGAAALVFGSLERGASLAETAAAAAARHAGDPVEIEAAVRRFAQELRAEELIVLDGDGAQAAAPAAAAALTATPADGPAPGPLGPLAIERYDDLRDLILLDPIHEVAGTAGWPERAPGSTGP